ncbi:MAG: hypothetical protein GC154_19295 [bacterium]|nr:hypothetical protein [bacterium]
MTRIPSPAPNGRRLMAVELEIDLFCQGLRVDSNCQLERDARSYVKARAGLGSGLELVIPGKRDIWMNAPVHEHFTANSPYVLRLDERGYHVLHEPSGTEYAVRIPPAPAWYERKASTGTPMREIGVLQGTYLGFYLGKACAFWNSDPRENCRFCATGLNVGAPGGDKPMKTVEEVVETAKAARAESGVSFVHFNTGYQTGAGLDLCAPFVKAIKEQAGALVGVQAAPTKELHKYDWIVECGADHLSFCYELHNPAYFERYLPGKHKHLGQDAFFKAMEYASRLMGKGRVSGEIIAGIEPIEDTLRGIDYITSVGAFPTVCIFRPVIGTDMEHAESPRYEDMRVVFQHVYESCMKNGVPIGLAPNIEVSLVVQPTDAEELAPPSWRKTLYQAKLRLMRAAVGAIFEAQLKPRRIKADAEKPPQPSLTSGRRG